MNSAVTTTRTTPQQYLATQRASEQKSEYLNGEVYAMVGASRRHNLIVTNVVRELSQQVKGRSCEVYPSDMRLKVSATDKVSATELYTYPDVSVVCDDPEFEDAQRDTLLNPTVLVDVLYQSTEAYDRGEKFAHYRKIPSLQDYLMIAQSTHRLEHYRRQPDGRWLLTESTSLDDSIDLPSIQCNLALAEIYDKVEVGDESSPQANQQTESRSAE